MKPKHLSLAIAALLAAGGLWFAWSAWRTPTFHESSKGVGSETPPGPESSKGAGFETPQGPESRMSVGSKGPNGQPNPGQMPRPPEPNRRFADFTPEQRVEFARKGHGPGG
jgi:hypothetical protein